MRRGDGFDASDGIPRNYHALFVAETAADFLSRHDLTYRGSPPAGHRFLAPPGEFEPDPETDLFDLDLRRDGFLMTVFHSGPADVAAIHAYLEESELGDLRRIYAVRREDRLVTADGVGDDPFYARSDRISNAGGWFTTVIQVDPDLDARLLDVISASITLDMEADVWTSGGWVERLFDMGGELVAASNGPDVAGGSDIATNAAPSRRPGADQDGGGTSSGSGTAFFINNNDLVTARHVIQGCASLTFDDGTPIELVATHPALDLALLSSPRRSRDWIPVHKTGNARLGQRVIALGYPFFGQITTALNSTGGNVSAMVGLGDNPDEITVTAAIHPGNSGGPLLALDGTVIGVVVSTIDKMAVAEVTGSIPENTNYAITGAALWSFSKPKGRACRARMPPRSISTRAFPRACSGRWCRFFASGDDGPPPPEEDALLLGDARPGRQSKPSVR